jgi:maleate cis-trans isomerase
VDESSIDDRLERGCIHLHGYMVVDDLYRKYETPVVAFSNQATFYALHRTTLDTNPLTYDEA